LALKAAHGTLELLSSLDDMWDRTVPEERIIPDLTEDQIFIRHADRYSFASGFVRGAKVLDVASGVGYGARILLTEGQALSVTGLDNCGDAVEYAREHYSAPGAGFVLGDCHCMPFEAGTFDAVVSLETLEHVIDHQLFVREIIRVLRRGGTLVMSTPNKRYDSKNPFHHSRFSLKDFQGLLEPLFGQVEYYGQECMSRPASLAARINRVVGYLMPQQVLDRLYVLKLRALSGKRPAASPFVRTDYPVLCRTLIAVCVDKKAV
jgi:SAM-dependent methyltransferase